MFSAGQLFGSVSVSPMNGHYFQFRMRRQVDMIVEKGKDLASLRRYRNTKQIFHKQETKTRYFKRFYSVKSKSEFSKKKEEKRNGERLKGMRDRGSNQE
jgi:hypothetical protein